MQQKADCVSLSLAASQQPSLIEPHLAIWLAGAGGSADRVAPRRHFGDGE